MSEKEGMKRSVDEDGNLGGSPNKRSRGDGDRVELRVLIQSKNAGAIIGKGGSNISRLRSDYKASITVPDCPGPERILTISADVEVICDVLTDIIPKLDDYAHHKTMDFECEVHMLVHQSQAGCIIGRAGFKIKELREKTGATIKVYSNCCPQSTDRVVQISGTPKIVVDCMQQIFELIQQSPIKGANNPYDPHNYDEFYAHEYGGFTDGGNRRGGRSDMMPRGGPRGGRGLRGMSDMGRGRMGRGLMGNGFRDMGRRGMGVRGPMPPPAPPRGFRNGGMGGRGNFSGRGRGPNFGHMGSGRGMGGGGGGGGPGGGGNMGGPPNMGMGNGLMNSFRNRMNNSSGGNSLMGSSLMGGGQGFNQSNMGHQDMGNQGFGHNQMGGVDTTSTQVTIPKDLAGSIIGKGGARIRKIRQDSGAGITIDEALPGAPDRIITITGTNSQIQMAQYLLQQSVREHSGQKF